MKSLFAVREVEPGHVHAGLDEGGHGPRLAAGRTDGADDLGAQSWGMKSLSSGKGVREGRVLQAVLQPLQQLFAFCVHQTRAAWISLYCAGGISPSLMTSATSSGSTSPGSRSEKFR